ncbi:MAG: SLC13 family permease [Ruthenibacterium lactatiformans]
MHLSPARILNFIRREAVLCCAARAALASTLFVPPSAAYISYFDFRVLCLLFCLMAVVAGLRGCGLFEALALRLLRGKKTLRFLALMLVLLPFFSSMLVTNDVALLTFVPFAILILNMADASAYAPYIIVLQTVAANLGSMATPVGNPQNLFLYNRFALSPADFFRTMLPLAAASLALLCMGVLFVPPRAVTVAMGDVHGYNTRRLPALSVLFVLCLLCVFRVAPYQLLTAVVLAMLTLFMRDLFREVDYSLLLTFVFFFIFAGNMGKIGGVNALLSALMDKHALPTCVLGQPGRQQRARRRPSFGLFTELARPADGHEPWRPRHAHCLSRKPDLPQALCPLRAGRHTALSARLFRSQCCRTGASVRPCGGRLTGCGAFAFLQKRNTAPRPAVRECGRT